MNIKKQLRQEIERRMKLWENYPKGIDSPYCTLRDLLSFLDTLQELDCRFPQYDDIVSKVFGAGNLESWEYEEAEQLVALAKEELLNSMQRPEVDLDFQYFATEMSDVFSLPKTETENTGDNPLNWEYSIAKHFYSLGQNSKSREIWHDANEKKPEDGERVLVTMTDFTLPSLCFYDRAHDRYLISHTNQTNTYPKHWCYISDIINKD